jgi:glycerate dehydrogenase
MKNIVVLDAHTLSPLQPGEHSPFHPNWDTLAALGPLQLYPRTKPDEVVARAQNAQILLTNKAVVSADHINALPQLEYIGVMATGYNIVDLDAARARGIPVTNIPGYGTASVAQHVFALLLELTARVGATDAAVKNGDWARCPDFCFTVSPFVELAGKTLGIVGYGTIGQAVARIAAAFGMRILATARSPKPSEVPVEWVSREELFRQSDVITLHCPLTEDTRHLINAASLATMKPSAFLINTGRGPLIDEAALATALKDGVIAGFGGDVLSAEPPSPTNPLLAAPRTVITPHIAWASVEARARLMGILAKNILDFLAGTPSNIVNGVTIGAAGAPVIAQDGDSASSDISPEPAPAPEGHGPIEPASAEARQTGGQDAPAAAPDAADSPAQEIETENFASQESTLETVAAEETVGVSSSAPEAPAETISQESEPITNDFAETAPSDLQEGSLDPISQEAEAEALAASDSPTPETPLDIAATAETVVVSSFSSETPADAIPHESESIANNQETTPASDSQGPQRDPLSQEAEAEVRAARDSTTPETTPDIPASEDPFVVSSVAPETPAETISHESTSLINDPEETPSSESPEPPTDPISQEAEAEVLAATDSTTPETTPEIGAPEESQPFPPSDPEAIPAEEVRQQDSAPHSPTSPEEGPAETSEEKKTDPPSHAC